MDVSILTCIKRHWDVETLSHRVVAGMEPQDGVWWAEYKCLCFVSAISTVPAMYGQKIEKLLFAEK